MTTQRERFEAWAKPIGHYLRPHDKGSKLLVYSNPTTRSAWKAWQEAERQMKERCATLCDKKAAYARLHGGAQNGALMAEMLADDIRAMGDEDE